MIIDLFSCKTPARLITMLSLLLVACVLSLSSCQQSSLTPLMSGTFISRDIYPNAKADLKAYNAVWYDPSEDTGE